MQEEGALGSKPLLLTEVCGPNKALGALTCEMGTSVSCPSTCRSDDEVDSLCKPSNVLL